MAVVALDTVVPFEATEELPVTAVLTDGATLVYVLAVAFEV